LYQRYPVFKGSPSSSCVGADADIKNGSTYFPPASVLVPSACEYLELAYADLPSACAEKPA